MAKKIPASAPILRTEEGRWDGFAPKWLAYDDRTFAEILTAWMGNTKADEFIAGLGLTGALTKDDLAQLISGGKVPSRELTNFLCA